MHRTRQFHLGTAAAITFAALLAMPAAGVAQAQTPAAAVAIDTDDIGGVVRGPNGPEAGVWVIAETRDLPTRFTRSVVTDDQGRYVLPDLPKAKYKIWVRGYGLVDSPKVDGEPGKQLNLTAVPAPNERAAAEYYPAIYWYSMVKIPGADQFGGKGDIPANIKQSDYLNLIKNNGCVGCHQLGQAGTRTVPKAFGDFKTGEDAWIRRTQSGQAGELMTNIAAGQLGGAPYKYFGDWTDRVAKGELPHHKPERPSGLERNVVVTTWDWADEKHYLHDLSVTDKRNPTVNGYGPVFGQPEYATDTIPILDPVKNSVSTFKAPVRDPQMPLSLGPGHAAMLTPMQPSAYWGNEQIWDTRINNHNSMIDGKGRMWLAAAVRGVENPAFCKKGSDHPSAKAWPLNESHRQLAMLDPKTMKYTFVDTCFTTHHLNFARDANDTLWASSGGGTGAVGWFNTKLFDETGDAAKAQGLDRADPRHQRQRQARRLCRAQPAGGPDQGQAHRPGVLCRDGEPGRRLDLGHAAHQPRLDRAAQPRLQPAGDGTGGTVQHPDARLRPARRRHRQPGPGVGIARQRPYGHVRPAQVQGPQRSDRDRQPLPRRLVVLPVSGPGLRRHRREFRRVRATIPGSTSTTCRGWATTRRSRPRTSMTAWSPSRTAR